VTRERKRRMSDDKRTYEAPEVEELPSEDGPAVTAAGDTPSKAVEWRPTGTEQETESDER
jgi:hypothetical protein